MYGLSNKIIEERYGNYKNALERLKEAMLEEPTAIIIDGTIQRYEFTFELAWKIMKDYLEYNGFVESKSIVFLSNNLHKKLKSKFSYDINYKRAM